MSHINFSIVCVFFSRVHTIVASSRLIYQLNLMEQNVMERINIFKLYIRFWLKNRYKSLKLKQEVVRYFLGRVYMFLLVLKSVYGWMNDLPEILRPF